MSLTVVVTQNAEPRFRGFLNSCMLEIAAGVYISPEMSAGVRDRLWDVLMDWHMHYDGGQIVMAYRDKNATARTGMRFLGTPPKKIIDLEGLFVVVSHQEQSPFLPGAPPREPKAACQEPVGMTGNVIPLAANA